MIVDNLCVLTRHNEAVREHPGPPSGDHDNHSHGCTVVVWCSGAVEKKKNRFVTNKRCSWRLVGRVACRWGKQNNDDEDEGNAFLPGPFGWGVAPHVPTCLRIIDGFKLCRHPSGISLEPAFFQARASLGQRLKFFA